MKTDMWNRLDEIGQRLGAGNQVITVIRYLDETEEDCEEKLARWRAGGDARDVSATPSAGDELVVFLRNFCQWSGGSEVTHQDYKNWRDKND